MKITFPSPRICQNLMDKSKDLETQKLGILNTNQFLQQDKESASRRERKTLQTQNNLRKLPIGKIYSQKFYFILNVLNAQT